MKINYSLRPLYKNLDAKTDSIEIDCTLEEFDNWTDEQHVEFRETIRDKHPRYRIVGYCPTKDSLEKGE